MQTAIGSKRLRGGGIISNFVSASDSMAAPLVNSARAASETFHSVILLATRLTWLNSADPARDLKSQPAPHNSPLILPPPGLASLTPSSCAATVSVGTQSTRPP